MTDVTTAKSQVIDITYAKTKTNKNYDQEALDWKVDFKLSHSSRVGTRNWGENESI